MDVGIEAYSFSVGSGHVTRLNPDVHAHQAKPDGYRRTSPLNESPASDGDGHLVDYERPGAARSGLTSACHLVTTGRLYPPWPQWSDAAVHKASR